MASLQLYLKVEEERAGFKPGETVVGFVGVDASEAWKGEFFDLILFWRSEGKGNSETGIAGKLGYCKRGEMVHPHVRKSFAMTTPTMPLTYRGVSVKIHWWLGLYVKALDGSEQFLEVPIVLHPHHETIDVQSAFPDDMPFGGA